jgi:hypothetical protein
MIIAAAEGEAQIFCLSLQWIGIRLIHSFNLVLYYNMTLKEILRNL